MDALRGRELPGFMSSQVRRRRKKRRRERKI